MVIFDREVKRIGGKSYHSINGIVTDPPGGVEKVKKNNCPVG
jgi:hypothetical protein